VNLFQAYLITCLANGKAYVGITARGLKRRWREHLYDARSGRTTMLISRAIAKYGADNFQIIPLCFASSWSELCALESDLIKTHGTKKPGGYNLSDGGEGPFGVKRSAESVERSAAKHRGKPCHPNTRLAASVFHKGKLKSVETRARMSAAASGMTRSSETRAKISAAKMGQSCNVGASNGSAKLTEDQVREARRRMAVGESQRSIARLLGIHWNAIWKIAHGLKWRSVV